MPQPKGFHPFTFIWAMQVAFTERVPFTTNSTFTYNKLFISVTEKGYTDLKAAIAAQGTTGTIRRIVKDFGKQKWYNDKVWEQIQWNDSFIYGNFVLNLSP